MCFWPLVQYTFAHKGNDWLDCYNAYNIYRQPQCAAMIHRVKGSLNTSLSEPQQQDVTTSFMEMDEEERGR